MGLRLRSAGFVVGTAVAAIREWMDESMRPRAGVVALIGISTGSALGALIGGALGQYAPHPTTLDLVTGAVMRPNGPRLSLVGRNLGNNRRFVAESEIGDAQLYVAPPRRFLAELTVDF